MRPVLVRCMVIVAWLAQSTLAWADSGIYLALGDSLAWGEQWSPAGEIHNVGYANLIAPRLGLTLIDLGCGGETTATMIQGGTCVYPGASSQLDAAEAYIRTHPVSLVTLDIGADDYSACLVGGQYNVECLTAKTLQVVTGLDVIVARLRAAGGPTLRIVAMNYYNPYLAFYFNGSTGQLEASATLTAIAAFNTAQALEYTLYGVPVADVASAFQSLNFAPTVYLGQQIPTNVAVICTDTWMCAQGNIHPNTAGYQLIADTILHALLPSSRNSP